MPVAHLNCATTSAVCCLLELAGGCIHQDARQEWLGAPLCQRKTKINQMAKL